MPTNRKRTRRGRTLDEGMHGAQVIHVELGDCLLAGKGLGCACGLRGEDGREREDMIRQIKATVAAGAS